MPNFQWLKFVDARTALADRLADANKLFWLDAELGVYITEALRTWNALTAIWNADYDLSGQIQNNQIWYNLSTISKYPRVRTVTDSAIYSTILYHLLEQQAPAALTGQFQPSDVYNAMQRRRDEIIQLTSCSPVNIQVPATPNTRETLFPDTVLSPVRARFVPTDSQHFKPITMWRDDSLAFQYFAVGYLQAQPGLPKAYSVISQPPLRFDVYIPPGVAGSYDFVVLQSGAALNQVNPVVLGIPDDFSWVNKFGALADVFAMESEITDVARAQYCLNRYKDGIVLMQNSPWIFLVTINGQPVDTVSVQEMDEYSVEWDSNPNARSCIVTGGVDFIAVSPIPTNGAGVTFTVVGNAPIPVLDGDFVQVTRDTFDVILDYAQHLAALKQGGAEFQQTLELAQNFFLAAEATNSRLIELGLFRDILVGQGHRGRQSHPRFVKKQEEQ